MEIHAWVHALNNTWVWYIKNVGAKGSCSTPCNSDSFIKWWNSILREIHPFLRSHHILHWLLIHVLYCSLYVYIQACTCTCTYTLSVCLFAADTCVNFLVTQDPAHRVLSWSLDTVPVAKRSTRLATGSCRSCVCSCVYSVLVAINMRGNWPMFACYFRLCIYKIIYIYTYPSCFFRLQVRCSKTGDLPSCDAECGKTLACGRHVCSEKCHPGLCPSCSVSVELTCHCGRTSKSVLCGEVRELEFSCRQICNRCVPACLLHAVRV